MTPLPRPERLLIVMLRRIGDVLLTVPAARALRKLFPEARIDFLAEPPAHELLVGNPDISEVLRYGAPGGGPGVASEAAKYLYWLWRVRRRRYDWVIDYMGNPRTAFLTAFSGAAVKAGPGHVSHRWAYTHPLRESSTPFYSAREKIRVLRSLGLEPDETDFLPSITEDPAAETRAAEALERLGLSGAVVAGMAPASRRRTRRWPARHFARLGSLLRDRCGARLLVFWGPGERGLAEDVVRGAGDGAVLAPETRSLRDLAALIGRCRLLVTNCNGPKHIAVARRVPTLTIHGSSDPVLWNPPDAQRHPAARRQGLDCLGCQLNDCPGDLACLEGLSPDDVFPEARRLLGLPARGALRREGRA